MLIGCGLFGMLLNFSQFLCTMHNSALTTTVVGVLKVMLWSKEGLLISHPISLACLEKM